MADRYETHIIGCLKSAIENAVDGVECHISAVTVQGAIDLLKERPQIVRCKDCCYKGCWYSRGDNWSCPNGTKKDGDGNG